MKAEELIKIKNLYKSFKIDFWKEKNHVLKDVSFSVGKGEIYGFLGHNGAGKTTTIKILNNLIKPDKGEVKIFGEDPTNVDIKKRIGYLPENPSFYDHLTGKEFLNFYADLHRLKSKVKNERVAKLIKRVGVDKAGDLKLKKYSKGMIQRIGLAQALINDPELLILDEPLSGLDPIGRYEVRDIILSESKKGKTIFFSSHLLTDVELICDYVTILVQGRVVSSGRIKDMVSKEIESWDITATLDNINKINIKGGQLLKSHEDDYLIRLLDEKKINPLIEDILKNGGRIKSVVPHRKTLEELFIKEMKKESVA